MEALLLELRRRKAASGPSPAGLPEHELDVEGLEPIVSPVKRAERDLEAERIRTAPSDSGITASEQFKNALATSGRVLASIPSAVLTDIAILHEVVAESSLNRGPLGGAIQSYRETDDYQKALQAGTAGLDQHPLYIASKKIEDIADKVLPPPNQKIEEEGGFTRFVSSDLPGAMTSLASFIVGGAALKGLGIPHAIGASLQGAVLESAAMFNETYEKTGGDFDKAMQSFSGGLLVGGLEGTFGGAEAKLAKRFSGLLAKVNQRTGGKVVELFATGVKEAGQETFQSTLADLIQANVNDEEFEFLDSLARGAEREGAAGGAAAIVLESVMLGRHRRAKRNIYGEIQKLPEVDQTPLPEGESSMAAQVDAFNEGRKPSVLVTPGSSEPQGLQGAKEVKVELDKGQEATEGSILTQDPQAVGTLYYKDDSVRQAFEEGRIGEALGYGQGAVGKPEPSESLVSLVSRDSQGRIVSSVVAERGDGGALRAAQKMAGKEGAVDEVSMEETEAVLLERAEGRQKTALAPEGRKTAAKEAEGLSGEAQAAFRAHLKQEDVVGAKAVEPESDVELWAKKVVEESGAELVLIDADGKPLKHRASYHQSDKEGDIAAIVLDRNAPLDAQVEAVLYHELGHRITQAGKFEQRGKDLISRLEEAYPGIMALASEQAGSESEAVPFIGQSFPNLIRYSVENPGVLSELAKKDRSLFQGILDGIKQFLNKHLGTKFQGSEYMQLRKIIDTVGKTGSELNFGTQEAALVSEAFGDAVRLAKSEIPEAMITPPPPPSPTIELGDTDINRMARTAAEIQAEGEARAPDKFTPQETQEEETQKEPEKPEGPIPPWLQRERLRKQAEKLREKGDEESLKEAVRIEQKIGLRREQGRPRRTLEARTVDRAPRDAKEAIEQWEMGDFDDITRPKKPKKPKRESDFFPERVDELFPSLERPPAEGLQNYLEKAQRAFVSQMARFEQVAADIHKYGGRISDAADVATVENLSHGRVEHNRKEWRRKFIDPYGSIARHWDIPWEHVSRFLQAVHAPDRNRLIEGRRIGKMLDKLGMDEFDVDVEKLYNDAAHAGMTTEDALKIVDEALNGPRAEGYKRLIEHNQKAAQELRDMQVRGGLISQETADRWVEEFGDTWVPLRDFPDPSGNFPITSRTNVRGLETKEAKGRGQGNMPDHVALAMAYLGDRAIVRAQQNEVAKAAEELVKQFPYLGIIGQEPPSGHVEAEAWKQNTIFYKDEGKQKTITFKDPRMARALMHMESGSLARAIKDNLGPVSRVFTQLATALSPAFAVKNFFRDIFTGVSNLSAERGTQMAGRVASNVFSAARALRAIDVNPEAAGEWADLARRFSAGGGKTGYVQQLKIDRLAKELENSYTRSRYNAASTRLSLRKMVDLVQGLSSNLENATRLAAFEAGLDSGMSEQQSLKLAKDLTVNFARKGEMSGVMGAMYLFFNPSVQGTARLIKALRGKNGKRVATAFVAAGAMRSFLNYLLLGGEDRDKDNREKPYKANSVFQFWTGNAFVGVPMPFGWNVFENVGNAAMNMALGMETKEEVSARMVDSMTGAFSPLGGVGTEDGMMLQFVMPHLGDLAVQLFYGIEFYGGKYRPDYYGDDVVKSQMYYPDIEGTPVQKATEWLNKLTDLDESGKGSVDVNPEDVQHAIEFAGSNAYAFVNRVFNLGLRPLRDSPPELKLNDIPIIRDFASAPDENHWKRSFRSYEGKFREYKRNLERKIQDGDMSDARSYAEKFRKTIVLSSALTKIDSASKRLHQRGPLYVQGIENFPDIKVSKNPQEGYELISPDHQEAVDSLIEYHQKRANEAARLVWIEEH